MDLKIRFLVEFCSRYTYPEVCMSKKSLIWSKTPTSSPTELNPGSVLRREKYPKRGLETEKPREPCACFRITIAELTSSN